MIEYPSKPNEESKGDRSRPPISHAPADAERELTLITLRKATIKALTRVIYGMWEGPLEESQKPPGGFSLEHDPQVRRRREAVEMLGNFEEREAADTLRALLLRGEKDIHKPAGAGRWLRDTALLTLLRPNKLPPGAAEAALWDEFAFLRHPWPFQWSSVYADLPWLRQYGKLRIFFLAFWLWPILLLAPAPLAFILQWVLSAIINARASAGDYGPSIDVPLSFSLVGLGAATGLFALVQFVLYRVKRRSTGLAQAGPRVAAWQIPAVLGFVLVALGLLSYPLGSLPPEEYRLYDFLVSLNAWVLIFGIGLETYLLHQVALALLAARRGPLLRISTGRPMATVVAWLGAGLTLIVVAILVFFQSTASSGCWQESQGGVSACGLQLLGVTLLLPLFLLPLYMLARDLEQFVRYENAERHLLSRILNLVRGGRRGTNARLALWAVILRRLTDVIYVLLLPLTVMSFWIGALYERQQLLLAFAVYLFASPLLVAGGLQLLSRQLEKRSRRHGGSATTS